MGWGKVAGVRVHVPCVSISLFEDNPCQMKEANSSSSSLSSKQASSAVPTQLYSVPTLHSAQLTQLLARAQRDALVRGC